MFNKNSRKDILKQLVIRYKYDGIDCFRAYIRNYQKKMKHEELDIQYEDIHRRKKITLIIRICNTCDTGFEYEQILRAIDEYKVVLKK